MPWPNAFYKENMLQMNSRFFSYCSIKGWDFNVLRPVLIFIKGHGFPFWENYNFKNPLHRRGWNEEYLWNCSKNENCNVVHLEIILEVFTVTCLVLIKAFIFHVTQPKLRNKNRSLKKIRMNEKVTKKLLII